MDGGTRLPGAEAKKLSAVEGLKAGSHRLRGRLAEELAEGGTQVSEDAYNLLKFHGTYEQHDRDTATALKQAGQEKDYSFMVRVRMPAGRLTAAQYLALDALSDRYGATGLRLTTRQGVQFHGIPKGDLKPAIADINATLLTTQAACGDVVRNVMTTPAPVRDALHARLEADARLLSGALLPASRAYHQIFLDEDKGSTDEVEPLYGATYLPRKFKIGIAAPTDNTPDVLTNDLGLLAISDESGAVVAYNVAVGGGLGMTHNNARTYPRLASILGSVPASDLVAVTEAVIRLQRDHGDRGDRRRARLKYVVDDLGVDWARETVGTYFGRPLDPVLPMPPIAVPDLLGWHEQGDGMGWLGVPVPSGRIDGPIKAAFRDIVARFAPDPIVTPQQDILLSNVRPADRAPIEAILRAHGIALAADLTPISRWALACPALPTCGLALTEAERVREPLIAEFEAVLARHGLSQERISLRITGCPNGCVRPYAGEIGLVGRVPGAYAIYLGGDFAGTRLSFQLLDRVKVTDFAAIFDPILAAFATGRAPGEEFGDFCARIGRGGLLGLAGRAEAA